MTGPTSNVTPATSTSPFGELADILSSLVAADSIPAHNRVLDRRIPKILSCDRSQLVLVDTAGQTLAEYSEAKSDTISLEDPHSPLSRCIRIRHTYSSQHRRPVQQADL